MGTERKRRRVVVVLSIAVGLAVMGFLAFGGIGGNLVYYWSPTEMKAAGSNAVGASIRLGGLVAPGSIERGDDGLALAFRVTDGDEDVAVVANAVPPTMFREGIGVVVEGTLRSDGVFETNRLMVKHDNQYQAPGTDDTRDVKALMRSLEPEAGGG